MKLTNRLKSIANLVDKNSIVGDIGTDHGYIPRYLIEKEISKYVIATDISGPSLDKTKDLVMKGDYRGKIQTRLGDGLDPIKEFEVDVVIIGGMGGVLISDILERAKDKLDSFETYILQPMVGGKELRYYLINNGFTIVKEDLAKEEDKIYEIILAKRGLESYEKDFDYEISPLLIRGDHPLWKDFVLWKMKQKEKIRDEIRGIKSEKSIKRLEELEEEIKAYREVLDSGGKRYN